MTSRTRVRLSARRWKETTPLVVPLAPSEDQAMRSSGTCSVVFAFQLRLDHQIFACQSDVVSSDLLALLTPLAKVLKSWYWVHWSYAVRSGRSEERRVGKEWRSRWSM